MGRRPDPAEHHAFTVGDPGGHHDREQRIELQLGEKRPVDTVDEGLVEHVGRLQKNLKAFDFNDDAEN